MSDESSEKNPGDNQSGGVNISADTVNIYGDVTGRGKSGAGGSETTPPPGGVPASAASSAPPLELSIRFERFSDAEDAPLRVGASVPNTNISFGPVDFSVPLDEKTMLALRWYLEEYWK